MKMKFAPLLRATLAAQRRRFLSVFLLPLVAAVFPLVSAHAQTITSAVPGLVSYQGKVTNASGTAVGTGTPVNRTVIFRIWSHSSNSTFADLVYSEQQTVTISEGEFSVLIGQGTAVSGTPLGYSESSKGPPTITFNNSFTVFGGAGRYLGVTVDDGTAAADPEVSPRQQLVTNAYAFRARFAEGLGSNGNFSVAVTDQGNLGIGLPNPLFPVTTAATVGDKIGLFGNFNYGIGIQSNTVQIHGASVFDDISFGYGASAGMTETVRFKGNGNVGIGTGNPTAKLDVNGAINVFDGGTKSYPGGLVSEAGATMINFGMNDTRFGTQTNANQGGFLRINAQNVSNLFQFYGRAAAGTGVSEYLSISGSGNVGIGNASPATKLDVNGGIRASGAGGYTFGGVGDTDGGVFSPADGIVTLWTNNSERLRVDSSGNLGVGHAAPGFPLNFATAVGDKISLFGNSGSHYGFGIQSQLLQIHTSGSSEDVAFGYGSSGAFTETMRVKGNGNVGVGTSTPATTLDVRSATPAITIGTSSGSNGALYLGNSGHGITRNYPSTTSPANNNVGLYTTAGDVYVSGNGQSTTHLVVKNSGYVGIGITDPKAPLHVKRAESSTPNNTRVTGSNTTYGVYLSGDGGLAFSGGASNAFGDNETISYNVLSAIFDGEVVSRGGYWTGASLSYSDARAKNLLGSSDSAKDLSLLRKLQIRDYTWIDRTLDNHRPHKKVIAQEVERVFPQAVRHTPRPTAIPSIYQVAEKLEFNAERKELSLTIAKPHDLKVGDSVDLATDSEPMQAMKVTAVSGEREFSVSYEKQPKSVFVFGKYVTDFRAVDYDALAMLNISATQELARQVDALNASEARNAELAKRVAELEAKDRARDAKLAAIEKLLSTSSTVMALPAKSATANGQD